MQSRGLRLNHILCEYHSQVLRYSLDMVARCSHTRSAYTIYMEIPNLAGVIDAKDVHTKGGGFAAKYMAWAKVAQLLHEHAPGWQFHLKVHPEKGHVWHAPDGTGYLVCCFTNPSGEQTADFLFPIMDHRNNPIPVEKVTARSLTDSHRRGLAACAAFTFSLGFELWADEEIRSESEAGPIREWRKQPKTTPPPEQPKTKPLPEQCKTPDKAELISEVVGFIQTKFKDEVQRIGWISGKAAEWDLSGEGPKLEQMTVVQLRTCIKELKKLK